MMSEITKILPVMAGGASSMDSLIPFLASSMGKDKDGFGGGTGLLLLLFVLFIAMGRGGLGGCGVNGSTPATATSCEFFQILNALGEVKTAIAASTGATAQNVDNAVARSTENANIQFAATGANIQETKASICRLGDSMNTNFREIEMQQTTGTASILARTNAGFNDLERSFSAGVNSLDKTIMCGNNNLNAQMINGMNVLQNQAQQNTSLLTTQASQNYCNLAGQIKDVNCAVKMSEERNLAATEQSKQAVLDALALQAKNAEIAALRAQLDEQRERSNRIDIDIAIGNRLSAIFGNNFGGDRGSSATK